MNLKRSHLYQNERWPGKDSSERIFIGAGKTKQCEKNISIVEQEIIDEPIDK